MTNLVRIGATFRDFKLNVGRIDLILLQSIIFY